MKITPKSAGTIFGAEVEGVDLAADLSEDAVAALRQAVLTYRLLVFHGQHLTPRQQATFSRRLGIADPVEGSGALSTHFEDVPQLQWLSYRRADGSIGTDTRPSQADSWHTDYSYLPDPPELGMLFGVELPPDGPRTIFVDMQDAYDRLSPAARRRAEGLVGIHNQKGGLDPAVFRLPPYLAPGQPDDGSADRTARHPLVRPHPVTGRPGLYIAQCYTIGFDGMAAAEGRDYLAALYDHALDEARMIHHVWQPGDCVIWDNAATNHRRSKPLDAPRVLHRSTIALRPPA